LALLADHGFDLEGTALVAPESAGVNTLIETVGEGEQAPAGANEIRMGRIAPNRLRIEVVSERGGLLVVSENWMPGWRAVQRDGTGAQRRLPVWRADLTLLGLPLSAGRYEIELVYWPDSVRYGLAISGVTLAALLASGAWPYLRRRRAGRDMP
jgi:hypothetical protein